MKKLSTEEKAKAYDDIIERLKDFQFEYRFSPFSDVIGDKFSELKESEDEKIRKALIEACKQSLIVGGFHKDKVIAWLEKQGEQKSVDKLQVNSELYEHIRNTCTCIDDALSSETLADINDYLSMAERSAKSAFDMIKKQGEQKPIKVEPKFHEGDWLLNIKYGNVVRVLEVLKDNYRLDFGEDTIGTLCTELVDSDYRLWDISKDAKPGDVLRILLFQKMKEAGYEWDAEKKELKKIEQKSAWSEEDEKHLNSIIKRTVAYGDSSVYGLIMMLKTLLAPLK